jgi:hypothetical protein
LDNRIRTSQSPIHWSSVFQLGLSLLGIALLWSVALFLVVAGTIQHFTPSDIPSDGMPFILLASAGLLNGLLLVPSAGYAFLRLTGRNGRLASISFPRWLRPTLLIFALPLVLLAGGWIAGQKMVAWLVLPPFHILAIGLPILWLAYLASRDLPLGPPQRLWGVLVTGSVLAPFVILLLEIAVLIAGAILWALWISGDPNTLVQLKDLLANIQQAQASNSPQLLEHILTPYLRDPLVIFSSFAFGAVIVPVIEEALKPLGVWFLAGSNIQAREGFTAGILCGAGYALAESLVVTTSGGTEWISLVFARMGTGVIHILTSGLTGWALALAWRERQYLRLGLVYLGVALIHGLWNGLTLLLVFSGFSPLLEQVHPDQWVPYVLVGMSIAGLASLLWINSRLRRTQTTPVGVV